MPPARWRLDLLGRFELSDGRQRLTRLHSRAAMALLARLALEPRRAQAREELAGLLWPDAPGDRGRARLRQTLSTLKALLERDSGGPAVIVADRLTVRLAPDTVACDAVAFEQAVRRRDAEAARALWAGELMPGFYDDWIVQERHRLEALAEVLVGGRAAAVAGPDAPPPTRAPLPPAPPEPAPTLPRYLDLAVGADAPLRDLLPLLTRHQLVTLAGPGGAGKTRLAVEAARRLARAARDAGPGPHPGAGAVDSVSEPAFAMACFVPLVDCCSAPAVGDRLLLALGLDAARQPLPAMARALSGQRALLVLDNAEQLDADARGLVAALLARLPMLHVLVTSRRPLGLDGEWTQTMQPLVLPRADTLAAVLDSDAAQLFAIRARASRPDFLLNAGNASAVARLVRRLDGWPLAIELAAARVRDLPPQRLLEALDPALGPPRWQAITRRSGRAAARQASMQGLVDWSMAQLAPTQVALLHWLAQGPPGVTPQLLGLSGAAAAPGGLAQRWADAAEARWLLDSLQAAGLLRQLSGADDRLWCALPEPVADHARGSAPDLQAAATRAAWRAAFLAWARGLPATVPLRELDATLPGLMACLRSAERDGAPLDLLRLVLALAPAWAERSLPAGAYAAMGRALDAVADMLATPAGVAHDPAGPADTTDAADAGPLRALWASGHALAAQLGLAGGERDRVRAHADTAAAHWPADPAQRSRARLQVARVRWRAEGRIDEARALMAQALADARAAGDVAAQAAVLTLQATLANEVDADAAKADALYLAALEAQGRLPAQLRNEHAHRGLRYNRAITAIYAGRAAEALPWLDDIEADAREQADRHLLAQVLNARGSALDLLGRPAEALQATQASLREAWDSHEAENTLYAIWNLAPLLLAGGDARRALVLMDFARLYWTRHFGALSAGDARDAERLCRRARKELDAGAARRAIADARVLALQAAVALGLGSQ